MTPLTLVSALAARPLSDQHWAMERFHACMVTAHRAIGNIQDAERDAASPLWADERDEFLAEIELFAKARDLALIEAAQWFEKCPMVWLGAILHDTTGEQK